MIKYILNERRVSSRLCVFSPDIKNSIILLNDFVAVSVGELRPSAVFTITVFAVEIRGVMYLCGACTTV